MIKSLWRLFLAIIAKPAKSIDYSDCIENQPIKHLCPIPANVNDFSKEEIRLYATGLANFILINDVSKKVK
jgi:hypothetical protein